MSEENARFYCNWCQHLITGEVVNIRYGYNVCASDCYDRYLEEAEVASESKAITLINTKIEEMEKNFQLYSSYMYGRDKIVEWFNEVKEELER
jgi:hypothetical protein